MTAGLEIVYYDDDKMDAYTLAAIHATEALLGYPLTIVQGCYNVGGVSASAGTHDKGGVIDFLPWDWQNKVTQLRKIGWAAWHRPYIAGLWGEHIHAVLIGHPNLADVAARQVTSYFNGRDGLKSNAVDPFPRPDPIPTFVYDPTPEPDPEPAMNHVQTARDDLAKAHKSIGDAYQELLAAGEDRPKAWAYREQLRQMRADITTILEGMPHS